MSFRYRRRRGLEWNSLRTVSSISAGGWGEGDLCVRCGRSEQVTVRRLCTLQPVPSVLVIPVAGEPSGVIWIPEARGLEWNFFRTVS
jgi:hypothetical protein